MQLTILDVGGLKRRPFNPPDTAEQLVAALVQAWVPYFECHKCGRFAYCKFVQRLPANPDRAEDIRCGVVVTALQALVGEEFEVFQRGDHGVRQAFLDAAYHFAQFIWSAETAIGSYLDPAILRCWGPEWRPRLFSSILSLRQELDLAAAAFQRLPEFKSIDCQILLEGYSEKILLDKVAESGVAQFAGMNLDVYYGKPNRKQGRLRNLVNRHRACGYAVFIQVDGDGNPEQQRMSARDDVKARDHEVFAFQHDLETAYPPEMLYDGLRRMGHLDGVDEASFVAARTAHQGNVATFLRSYSLVLENDEKAELAGEIGGLLRDTVFDWWNEEEFHASELSQFLDFVQDAHVWPRGKPRRQPGDATS